ncbi:sensor histidine kinase [Pseudomonas sp. McL0111]|uniref:sensor histidine kinase n=1 Tax=Pseudomonas sp. McL0111 TaxID=3457357 RepID=UPI00403EF168
MGIKFKARVLLELGAELISSDQIALYELIKNALDARSPKVVVTISSVLSRGELQRLEYGLKNDEFADDDLEEEISSSIDPSASSEVISKFTDSICSALPELRASILLELYSEYTWIRVEDTGHGMSEEELDSIFLTIGTPNRLLQRALIDDGSVLGEKGIGRLSSMRLGDFLEVESTKVGEKSWNKLVVDWSVLKRNPNLDADKFEVSVGRGERKSDSSIKGTCITIRNLQSDWSSEKLRSIADTDFAKLINPFNPDANRPDIRFFFNKEKITIPTFESEKLAYAHATCKAQFGYDKSGQPVLKGSVTYNVYGKSKQFELTGVHLRSALAKKAGRKKKAIGATSISASLTQGLMKLGEFKLEAHWFNRQKLRLDKPDGYDSALKWLANWGGGLLLYRDNFRVYPYAEIRDDWLDLDGVAFGSGGYKMNRKQIVGSVSISGKKNPELQDQTNREGLRDNDEKAALVALLRHTLLTEFKTYLNSVEGETTESAAKEFPKLEKRLDEAQQEAVKHAKKLRERVGKEDVAVVNSLLDRMQDMALAWEKAKLAIKNYEAEIDNYVHLAGVGLMTEFIFHELSRMTHSTLKTLKGYSASTPAEKAQLKLLREQLDTLDKRIRILDPLATPGRQRKENFDLVELIKEVLQAHSSQFERHEIKYSLDALDSSFKVYAVKGQVIQIFENLISNSVYWLKQELELRRFSPKIEIMLDPLVGEIQFSDNGPGIPVVRGEEIFNPFFSTKPADDGRGLGLFISRKLAEYNSITIDLDDPGVSKTHRGFVICFKGKK